MYNNRNTSFGRSNRGYQQSNFGRFNAPRPRFRNVRKPRKFGENLDASLFIKKACEIVTIEEAEVLHNFDDFGFDQILLKNIKDKGYTKPTQIQDQVISYVISGQDVLGIASTGTGKTAAFALPLIDQIVKHPEKRILVLAPTRELAMQIRQEIRSFTFGLKVYVSLAIGGAFLKEQIRDIQRDPHIIVGTPGRIKDLGDRKVINFAKMDTLVLDEVDRMLDMGFIHDIKEIVAKIPANRQTLFFSATMDRKMEGLVDSFLTNPAKVSIKAQNSSDHVEQNVVMVNRNNKQEVLIKLLHQEEFKKVLIFGATKRMVENVSQNLIDTGFRAGSLHGNKTQQKRQNVLRMFKENVINVLVATDVAARGLDVADITHVINFDKPNNYEDYIHRIGRTGRANAKGYALTFVETRY